ncbi:uncharacterized protein LOC127002681 [Eriocheir sinensis]|uniref:uncharacterized protein LOC127002681 n=1 Tax=Eriocheir sinensis TaxID=95602 RepID=UPI0021C68DEA|nr:uncharacterized protein LOC127002681 [Eriocheir sinensis]
MQSWAALWAWATGLWAWVPNALLLAAAAAYGWEDAALWRHISVESSWLKVTVTQTPRNLSLIPCGAACMRQDWCRLWCHELPSECLFTSLIASASYTPAKPGGALSCYTSRIPDLAVGAAITSSPNVDSGLKPKENLVDGIYPSKISDCAAVAEVTGGFTAWYLVDLGAAVPVSEVVMVTQPNNNTDKHFVDVEVRVGDVQMSGDFTTYPLLGFFLKGATAGQFIVMRPAAPMTGRYVSIQRTTIGNLQVCHLEIR